MSILLLLLASLLLEIGLYLPLLWRFRVVLAGLLAVIIPALSIWLLLQERSVMAALIAIVSVLRVVNLLRIVENRMRSQRLYKVAIRTSGFAVLLTVIPLLVLNNRYIEWPGHEDWVIAAGLQLFVALSCLIITRRTLRRLAPELPQQFIPDKELPTLTIAIPARNETPELVDCLKSVIESDYPKLEIIVLDDCSHDKTPALIKDFAHDGVRFIQGDEPGDRWLPKNAAYQRLLQEATGDYILFCGVDVRFDARAIRMLMNTLLTRHKEMMSVLPTRSQTSPGHTVLQPLRYWWELALPRRILNRPAVLSTCWVIQRDALLSLGGFESVSRSVLPERLFARELVRRDSYSFVRSTPDMRIETSKSLLAQRDTVVRMRYPQVHRRLELSYGLVLAEIAVLLVPYIMLVWAVITGEWWVASMSLLTIASLMATNYLIVRATSPQSATLSLLVFPLSAATEIFLGIESMLKYEFSTVDWKGRNICLPVMQVIPRLPKLDK